MQEDYLVKDILSELNEIQRQAVEHTDGPVMVIAGAGSGKTRVLTYRVAHLIQKGIDPFNILALTFTNKAAKEMKERIIDLVGPEARNVWMGTFHSVFAKVLRIEGHLLGYPSNFTIYDTDDTKSLLRTLIKEQNLDNKVYTPNIVLNRISSAKSGLISARDYNQNKEIMLQDKSAGRPMIGPLYTAYQNRLFKAQAMDFDDLLFQMNVLLRDFPEVLYKYQQRFGYVLVDEYQDTNHAQYLIIKKLVANTENITIVGDDAQSIYAFRGANIQNILNFKNDYPDQAVYKLEQNYRSTQNIVNAANSIIAKNKDQIFKEVWTSNEPGPCISMIHAGSDTEEGMLVASSIFETKMNEKRANKDFTILYRTNSQSRAMEEALRKKNIPYRIYGGLSFYHRKEIKDLLAYYRLVINHNDEEALNRIINFPVRGIGKTTLEKITIAANQNGISMWEVIRQIPSLNLALHGGIRSKLSNFQTMISSFQAQLKSLNAYDLAKHIASSSGILKTLYDDKTPEGISRFENIEELLNAIKEFCEKPDEGTGEIPHRSLQEFMQDIALLTDSDKDDKADNDKVSLMTIHASKGLEFPYVYIVGMEENLFPSMLSLNSRADLEEERRLFYVAVTRAEKRVTISYAENRYRWGQLTLCEPSRFIDDIDPRYLDMPQIGGARVSGMPPKNGRPKINVGQRPNLKKINSDTSAASDFESSDTSALQVGMQVEHQKFGKGKVINLEGNSSNKKATVFFPNVGQKQLLLKFAKLKIIN